MEGRSVYLAQLIGSLKDGRFELGVADVTMNCVADAEQFVSIQDDELWVCHENFRRLIVLDGQDESVDGVGQIDHVGLRLTAVEFHYVAIVIADLRAR